MNNSFSERAWEEYLYWQKIDKNIALTFLSFSWIMFF